MQRFTVGILALLGSLLSTACRSGCCSAPCATPACRPCDGAKMLDADMLPCGAWPDWRPVADPLSPFGKSAFYYLEDTIAQAQRQLPSNRMWGLVIDSATRCEANTAPGHAHLSHSCMYLWNMVRFASQYARDGDARACLDELDHPDHTH